VRSWVTLARVKFPKPRFSDLLTHYDTEPESTHICPRLISRPVVINTCAIRISEGLVLANGLARSRAAITALTSKAGTGKSFLLGKYDYKANLCPHGIGRGASDVGYWLREQWGRPTYTWENPGGVPTELAVGDPPLTGVLCFIKIPGYEGQGHMDVWNESAPVGHASWDAAKILFWKLS
jgi:hypothetical protein